MSTSSPLNLAEQLRDVHLPSEVSMWPLAPGWWVLIVLILTVILVVYWLFRRKRLAAANNRYRLSAKHELQSAYQQWREIGGDGEFLAKANSVLKRCCLHLHAGLAAGQHGDAWREELKKMSPNTLSEETELALTLQLYQAEPEVDVERVYTEVGEWLDQHAVDLQDRVRQTASVLEQGDSHG